MSTDLPQQWFDRAREDLQVARLVLQGRHYQTETRLSIEGEFCIQRNFIKFTWGGCQAG